MNDLFVIPLNADKEIKYFLYNYKNISKVYENRKNDLIDSINVSNRSWLNSLNSEYGNTLENILIKFENDRTLKTTPTCGTTIWVQSSATPVSCAVAMTSSATGASTSSASAAVTAPSLSLRLPTPRCTSSISRALPSSPSSSVPARCPFT